MGRVSKSSVHTALQKAAKNIRDAAGKDGISSRKEIQAKVKTITDKREADLTRQLAAYIDNRDAAAGARLTGKDLDKAVAYFQEHGLDNYDRNKDGFSRDEYGDMSKLGKFAVDLALQTSGRDPFGMSSSEVSKALTAALKGQTCMSESDYPYTGVTAAGPGKKGMSAEAVYKNFKPQIEKFLKDEGNEPAPLAYEAYTPAEVRDFFKDALAPGEEKEPAELKAWQKATVLFNEQLKDVQIIKVGPKDPETGKLATDQGLYGFLVVGKATDGRMVGVMTGKVET